jgi:hypothetical protein
MTFLNITTRSNGKNQRSFFAGKRRSRVAEKQSSYRDDCEATAEFSTSDNGSSSLGNTTPATNTNTSLLNTRHEYTEETRRRRELLTDNCNLFIRELALYRNGDLDFDSDSESSDEEDEDEDNSGSESSFEDDDGTLPSTRIGLGRTK